MRPLASLALPALLAISTLLVALVLLGGPFGCGDDEVSPRPSQGPTADFSCPTRSGTVPLIIALSDESIPGSSPISGWSWTFGDGATSGDQDPTHTYATPGRYAVSLTVTTAVGSDTKSQEEYVVALARDEPPRCTVDRPTLHFGSVSIGESYERIFNIYNNGGGTLAGIVSASCTNFTIFSGEGAYSLGAGQSHRVRVRFTPQAEGTDNCTIDTGSECNDVSCTGVGVEGQVACSVDPVNPVNMDFSTVAIGSASERSFSITNTGAGILAGNVNEPCIHYRIV